MYDRALVFRGKNRTNLAVEILVRPNPFAIAWSIVRAMRVARPRPSETSGQIVEHGLLANVLEALAADGVGAIDRGDLAEYRDSMAAIDPDDLDHDGALAYWLNVYNAGALDLAARTQAVGEPTVLRTPGAFDDAWITVADETLSLNDIEHGKIRRFRDPRIHGALVCGSASCPSLRHVPYGDQLDAELQDQIESFLRNGGAVVSGNTVRLSRILLWYGADFVRPHRMPTFLPAGKRDILAAVAPLIDQPVESLDVEFQAYDWALSCSIG